MTQVANTDAAEKRRLANLRPWAKGVSGNPSGKSKRTEELRLLAQKHSKRAIQRLVELIESADERVAVMAAKEILDRGLGKARPVEDDGDGAGKSLTINIIKYADGNQSSVQLEAPTISVRPLALS